ncbi:MAG TPA: TauD/TfdA family dioxygenase [Streptosporangiaceae bacterium]|nr:TauD/TfdA family dioxygenase [Streptosporangiaceae bacterium]
MTELTLSLLPDDIERMRRAALECLAFDLVKDPDSFVDQAQRQTCVLPAPLLDALRAFRRHSSRSGGLLIRGMPVFEVPSTPSSPAEAVGTRLTAAGLLGIVAAVIGDQYGFKPELDGQIIQDIIPVAGFEETQQSISSTAELYTHVELAFTDDRADHLALFCLRADHERVAATTLSPIESMLPLLSGEAVEILGQHRFKTTVDMSFLRGIGTTEPIYAGPIRVFSGSASRPRIRADFAETTGIDADAQAALDELRYAAEKVATSIFLEPGDLLVIDNHHAFHGRTPFTARGDGQDRWLLRTSTTRDLSRSAARRPGDGRVIDVDYSADDCGAGLGSPTGSYGRGER